MTQECHNHRWKRMDENRKKCIRCGLRSSLSKGEKLSDDVR